MSVVEDDIDRWARDHLFKWANDVLMRCDVAGIDHRASGIIAALTIELASRAISSTTMTADRAGMLFAEAIKEYRRVYHEEKQQ